MMFPSIEIVLDPAISELSPPLHPEEEARLEASLSRDGCCDALIVYRNQKNELVLLDGHRRFQICRRKGLAFSTREVVLNSLEEALAWVSENHLLRRNLNETQRAMLGAQLANLRQGARTDLAPIGARSQGTAAKAINASRRSIQRATVVLQHGAPELIRACRRGILSVSVGAVVSQLPLQEQELIARECLASADAEPARRAIAGRKRAIAKEADATKLPRQNDHPLFSVLFADPFRCEPRDGAKSQAVAKDERTAVLLKELNMLASELAGQPAPDATLFLWTDGPHLAEAVALLSTWGFEYQGSLVAMIAEGKQPVVDFLRYDHQLILLGRRGTPSSPSGEISSFLSSEAFQLIERLYPSQPRLELFFDRPRPEWHWLHEASGTIGEPINLE